MSSIYPLLAKIKRNIIDSSKGEYRMPLEGVGEMEEWKNRVQQDITEIKQRQSENEGRLSKVITDVHKLEVSDQLQDREINSLKETISEIKSDTSFIRTRMDEDREEQLRQYRNMTWKIVTAIVIAGFLAFLGLQ